MAKITVKLSEPIRYPDGAEPVTEITLRPLKLKHLRRIERAKAGQEHGGMLDMMLDVLVDRSGLDADLLDELDAGDVERIFEELGKSLPTGTTP